MDGEDKKQDESTSGALVHAHQQLHPHSNAGVPAQWQQSDVTSYDGWPQEVLHCGGAVRVPIENLRREQTECSLSSSTAQLVQLQVGRTDMQILFDDDSFF